MIDYGYVYISLWIFILMVIVTWSFIASKSRYCSVKNASVLVVVFVIYFLLWLRDPSLSTDYSAYVLMYEKMKDAFFLESEIDRFFSFFLIIGNFLQVSPDVFFSGLSVVYFLATIVALRMIGDNNFLLISIYFILSTSSYVLMYLNVIRQGLAFIMFLFAIAFYLRGSLLASLLALILCFYSHGSALILMVIFGFAVYLFRKRNIVLMMLLFLPGIFPILGNFIVTNSVITSLFPKLVSYSNYEYGGALNYVKLTLDYIWALIFVLLAYRFRLYELPAYKFILICYLLLLSVSFLVAPVPLVSARFQYYAAMLLPILFSLIFLFLFMGCNSKKLVFLSILVSGIYSFFVHIYEPIYTKLGAGL